MGHDIFISYSHEDKTSADAACAILESQGLRCWIAPRDILPGSEWTESIMDGIAGAKALVLIFSRYADESPQVRREVERAIHHAIPIVPVRIEDVTPGKAMEYLISTPHWLDAISPPLEAHYRSLAGSLKLLIQQNAGRAESPAHPVPPIAVPLKGGTRNSKAKALAIFAAIAAIVLMVVVFGRGYFAHSVGSIQPESALVQPSTSPAPAPAAVNAPATAQPVAQPPSPAVYAGAIVTNSFGMKFVQIKPGTFLMGSPPDEVGRADNETQHRVTLTKGFYMGQTDVTVAQFTIFVDDSGYQTQDEKLGMAMQWDGQNWSFVRGGCWRNPGFGQDQDYPVVDVSWNDAQAFCDWISRKEGKSYRLPTETEFEYCARAGTTTTCQWGNNPDDANGRGNFKDLPWLIQFPTLPSFSWSDGYKFTSPVAKFPASPWNLYDLPGNVFNWCSDWYGDYPTGDVTDPHGPSKDAATIVTNRFFPFYHGPSRVLRGAAWASGPNSVRSAVRGSGPPFAGACSFGFRLVLDSP